jgi:hypothetical protein
MRSRSPLPSLLSCQTTQSQRAQHQHHFLTRNRADTSLDHEGLADGKGSRTRDQDSKDSQVALAGILCVSCSGSLSFVAPITGFIFTAWKWWPRHQHSDSIRPSTLKVHLIRAQLIESQKHGHSRPQDHSVQWRGTVILRRQDSDLDGKKQHRKLLWEVTRQ